MNTSVSAPADNASSTAYWMSGLSTIGSISFGLALVMGKNLVPRPATGNTAVLMGLLGMPEMITEFNQVLRSRGAQSYPKNDRPGNASNNFDPRSRTPDSDSSRRAPATRRSRAPRAWRRVVRRRTGLRQTSRPRATLDLPRKPFR